MKVDPRVQRNSLSIVALRDLLREIVKDTTLFASDETLMKALKSQGAMSKLTIVERQIYGSSLNTLKRITPQILEGGFETLDRLRVAALDSINTHNAKAQRSNKVTKVGLAQRVKELENEVQQALQDLWHVTMAFQKALAWGRNYAKEANNPAVIARCEREHRDLRAMLSLCNHPVITLKLERNDGAN